MNKKYQPALKIINRIFYIMGISLIAFAILLSSVNFPVSADEWDNADLIFEGGCQGECWHLNAKICNRGSGSMALPGIYEVYLSVNGDPHNGSLVTTGSFPALATGTCSILSFSPNMINGNYAFKAYQTSGHPGPAVVWSDTCSVTCVFPTTTSLPTITTTPTSKFTQTNTPTFTATVPSTATPTEVATMTNTATATLTATSPATSTVTPTNTVTSPATATTTPQDPTPTSTATSTSEVPTATLTNTPEILTATPEQPTATPQDPTPTPEQPTATPQDPTPTPEQPTATPQEPSPTPEQPTATPQEPTSTPQGFTATPQDPTPSPQGPTPTGVVTTQAPTLPPPPISDTPSVLIPVTGVDLSRAGSVNRIQDTMLNLGLGFLGFAFVFTGIRRRLGL